jgi:hypothetical protein
VDGRRFRKPSDWVRFARGAKRSTGVNRGKPASTAVKRWGATRDRKSSRIRQGPREGEFSSISRDLFSKERDLGSFRTARTTVKERQLV